MNASFWDPKEVSLLRCQLLNEHLDQDTRLLDDSQALRLYRNIARENRLRRQNGDFDWQGLAYHMDSTNYGELQMEETDKPISRS